MGTNITSPTTPKKAHSTPDTQSGTHNPPNSDVGDTPHRHKSTPHVSGHEFAVNVTRNAVMEDLGPAIPEVEYDFFRHHILPPLHSSIDIDKIITRLEADEIIIGGRWKQFPKDPWTYTTGPSNQRRSENQTFADLEGLLQDIIERLEVDASKTVEYKSLPDYTPTCSFEEKKGRPDAFFVLSTAQDVGKPYWRDIVTPAEFKLKDTPDDLQDDINKICWDMHQAMREDPRRRFVFAFTIENTQMRVWMLNRSGAAVSEPFNFITDHKKFLHFFLSQTYAPVHQLGIDTTMTIVQEHTTGASTYDITVRDADSEDSEPFVFRTDGLINDDGAKSPLGRGTRIWRVARLVDGKLKPSEPGRVLKDSWVDEDREREGDILEKILGETELNEGITELFLTPVVSGDVAIDGKPDCTRGCSAGVDIPSTTLFQLRVPPEHKPSHTNSTSTQPLRIAPATEEQRLKILKYSQKQHYRIVFVEECEPLSKQTSLYKVFKCLVNVSNGLSLLHTNGPGWVHRDISIGNILYVPQTDTWVLADLEYTKRLNTGGTHEIRTGTANFMAVEVDCGVYLTEIEIPGPQELLASQMKKQKLAKSTKNRVDDEQLLKLLNIGNQLLRDKSARAQSSVHTPFHYNPTHDLESLFWIALYFVTNKEVRPATLHDSTSDLAATATSTANIPLNQTHATSPLAADSSRYAPDAAQLKFAADHFYTRDARIIALSSAAPLEKYFKDRPAPFDKVGAYLCELRTQLHAHYAAIEKPGYTIDKRVCEETGLYVMFQALFVGIMKLFESQDFVVSPLPRNKNAPGALRSASTNHTRTELVANGSRKRKAVEEEPVAVGPSTGKGRKDGRAAKKTTKSRKKAAKGSRPVQK